MKWLCGWFRSLVIDIVLKVVGLYAISATVFLCPSVFFILLLPSSLLKATSDHNRRKLRGCTFVPFCGATNEALCRCRFSMDSLASCAARSTNFQDFSSCKQTSLTRRYLSLKTPRPSLHHRSSARSIDEVIMVCLRPRPDTV